MSKNLLMIFIHIWLNYYLVYLDEDDDGMKKMNTCLLFKFLKLLKR